MQDRFDFLQNTTTILISVTVGEYHFDNETLTQLTTGCITFDQ